MNLSRRGLSEEDVSLLSKGLKFSPTPTDIDKAKLKEDLEAYKRRMRLRWHFRNNTDSDSQDASDNNSNTFRIKSTWQPPKDDPVLENYLSLLEKEVLSVSPDGKNFSNLSSCEQLCLKQLKCDRNIVIKEGDKGSAVVVWDREDYISEANRQLDDRQVYEEVEVDPSVDLGKTINSRLNELKEEDPGLEEVTDYLKVKDSKLGRFYLLPKIHKGLSSVKGRPVTDLPCAVKNSTTSMYADDTTLFFRSKNIEDLNEAINSDLRDLDSWLSGNKLSLNVAKTQGMLICTKNKQRSLECTSESLCLKIRDNDLALVEKTKYLGVQVDNSLDWKEHIKSVSAKVSRAVGLLKYAKRFLPQNSLKTLYTSIVEPHFRYCCAVWGCCGTTEISKLQKLQNRAARIITNSSFDASSKPLIQNLGWKTVNDMIKHESRTMVYKSINNIAPPYMNDMFTRNSQDATRQLRNTNTDLKLPKKRTCNGQKSFSFRGAKLWNSLDTEAKRATSLNRFKSLI